MGNQFKKFFTCMSAALLATGIIATIGVGNISSAAEADLIIPETITLPIPENRETAVTIADGYVYYMAEKGLVYQAPLDDPSKAKVVYQMPDGNDYSEDGFPAAWLTTINGTAILKYHIGSASMGTDYAEALHSDGSCEELPGSFSNSVKMNDAEIVLASDYRTMEFEIRHKGEKAFTPLGESNYSYGTYMITAGQSTAHMVSSDLAAVGDEVYVIATKWNETSQTTEPVGIYQVNINTNETKRVFPESATHFRTAAGNIYFTDLDGFLYKAKLGSNQAEKVSEIKMDAFFIVGDEIYYTPYRTIDGSGDTQELFRLSSGESLAPGCILEYAPMDANSSSEYLACLLYNLSASNHNGIVIDETGGYVLLNSDDIQYVTYYNGAIYEVVRAQAQDSIKLIIDGQQVSFSKTDGLGVPFIESGRTLVPLRKPLEAIGASVDYDAASRTVTIKKDETEISIVIDGEMLVNGSRYQVDAPAMLKDGRVYVPIRHIFEALGYSLSWNAETKTVNISKTDSPIETVAGWSVPSPATGSTGLGMTDYIGVLAEFADYSEYGNTMSLSNPEQINELNSIQIGLRNFSENKPVWLNSITFEYQVYKNSNGKEELVYRKEFSLFEGSLPAQSGTITELGVNYWNPETTAPGEYTVKLAYPEYFTGIEKESNKEVKISIADNIFGGSAVITVTH